MKWQPTRTKILSDEQVESHIREWNERADAMEKMSLEEAKRFVSGSQPDQSRFFEMTMNMENKIRKEAPTKDAEKRMLEAWKRRTRAYQKMLAMIQNMSAAPRKTTTTTTAPRLYSCTVCELSDRSRGG